MKYMLLIYIEEGAHADSELQACYTASAQYAHELARNGNYIAASPLYPSSTATSLQVREGKRFVSDGPFAETREQLGGYFLIDAPNLDEALAIATRLPGARLGTVEVRPVLEVPGLPEADIRLAQNDLH